MDKLDAPDQGEKTKPNKKANPIKQTDKNKGKSKLFIGGMLVFTVILAGIAIASAYKLYQLREEEQVAPTAPKEAPAAVPECELSFSIPSPTGTLTPTLTPTNTPTGTMSPTLTPTNTPTNTLTPTSTPTGTLTPTNTPTNTPIPTNTPTGTLVPTNTPTNTPIPTSTPTEKLVVQTTSSPTPTKVELPEAGFTFPSQVLVLMGTIISLSGLLFIL